jgi:uncharacterized protein (DUF169 family)
MNWNEYAAAIEKHIRPATFPLAIKMLNAGEEPPAGARRPWKDLGVRMATCQLWNTARRYGWTLAAGLEDLSCPPGKVVLGFEPAVPFYTEGHLCENMYTASAEAGARTEAATARFAHDEYATVVAAPLARATWEPDVVVVYGNPAQVLRLAIAALYQSGGRLEESIAGRLDCSDFIVATPRGGVPRVVLPCYGDRIFGQTQDDEMAFALPPALLPALIEGLEGTHKGGIRYPIPNFMRYTGKYPATYEHLEDLWGDLRNREVAKREE